MDYKELKELHKRAKRIIASDLDWDVKYDMIFSEDMSHKVDFEWYDPDMDSEALDRLGRLLPGREIVGVDGRTLALGGGGVHCVTQQVPVVSPAEAA